MTEMLAIAKMVIIHSILANAPTSRALAQAAPASLQAVLAAVTLLQAALAAIIMPKAHAKLLAASNLLASGMKDAS
jgi:hypothetical protein